MANRPDTENATNASQTREDRLKAALKANLSRRKAQSRKRAGGDAPQKQSPGATGQDKDA